MRGLRLVRTVRRPIVSAGNTGACMATAKMVLGTLPELTVPRWRVFPTNARHGDHTIDVAPMSIPSRKTCSSLPSWAMSLHDLRRSLSTSDHPRVGVLSIGEEESKGNELTKEAFVIKEL